MTIYLFTNSKTLLHKFELFSESSGWVIEVKSPKEFFDTFTKIPGCSFIYLDIQSLSEDEIESMIHHMIGHSNYWYGIIDPKNEYQNIASLFHRGISDYISKKELTSPLDPQRVETIRTWKQCFEGDGEESADGVQPLNIIKSKKGWDTIEKGKEYSFVKVFIAVEELLEMKNSYGYKYTNSLVSHFHDYVSLIMQQQNGRLMLKDTNKSLFLFPYADDNSKVITTAYLLMLNRVLISGEVLRSPNLLKYTVIIHLGNTPYLTQDEAGLAVSDSLNFIFHVANTIPELGQLYVTDTLFSDIPKEIEDLFIKAPQYEGHAMKRLMKMNF